MTRIDSRQNPRIAEAARLLRSKKHRRAEGKLVAEGATMLEEALASGAAVSEVFVREGTPLSPALLERASAAGARVYEASARAFAALTDVETPTGLSFVASPGAASFPKPLRRLLIVDALQDPGNLGTILRSAHAFGVGAVALCEGTADATSPKVVRATMGAIFRLPWRTMDLAVAVALAKEDGLIVFASSLSAGRHALLGEERLGRAAIIIGNESAGVSDEALALSDRTLHIPMPGGAESLNAAVAASLILWEMSKEG